MFSRKIFARDVDNLSEQKRVLFVNTNAGVGSTGRICVEQAAEYKNKGWTVRVAYGREQFVSPDLESCLYKIKTPLNLQWHVAVTRLFDAHGTASTIATKKFLRWAEKYNPNLLWLHNIHGYYINVEMLFKWIKTRPDMEVRWTLHDGWAFTGHCACFNAVQCNRWITGCYDCPQKNEYPKSILFDGSKRNYLLKKAAFTGVKNMTIITPSNWLADRVRKSFLGDYKIIVQYNKINKEIFKPTQGNFREKYGLQSRKIILGVASAWQECKGLYDFIELSKMLPENYIIVLVGLTDSQLKMLPGNMIGIKRTNNIKELAEIYTAADIFANPSKEETFGLTTLEAIECGTQVIVYKGTACEEIAEKFGGLAVEPNVKALYNAIMEQ